MTLAQKLLKQTPILIINYEDLIDTSDVVEVVTDFIFE